MALPVDGMGAHFAGGAAYGAVWAVFTGIQLLGRPAFNNIRSSGQ